MHCHIGRKLRPGTGQTALRLPLVVHRRQLRGEVPLMRMRPGWAAPPGVQTSLEETPGSKVWIRMTCCCRGASRTRISMDATELRRSPANWFDPTPDEAGDERANLSLLYLGLGQPRRSRTISSMSLGRLYTEVASWAAFSSYTTRGRNPPTAVSPARRTALPCLRHRLRVPYPHGQSGPGAGYGVSARGIRAPPLPGLSSRPPCSLLRVRGTSRRPCRGSSESSGNGNARRS